MMKERKDFLTLDEIMSSSPEKARKQVVFIDIVKYSKRDDKCQLKLIKSFTEEVKSNLYSITEEYGKENRIESSIIHHNIIKIPTGDGIAIGFPFPRFRNLILS
jgi:molybdopterin synthase catalytic subunit